MFKIFCAFLLCQVILFSSQNTKNILILHSYSQSYSWTKNIQNGIDSIFDTTEYKLQIEYMDTKKYHAIKNFQNLIPLYKDKYKDTRFDAIIVSDNNAFSFFKFNRDELFKDTPTVFCGINNLTPSDIVRLKDVTGISEEPDILENLHLIKKLHPANKNVYVVVDTTTTGNITYFEIKKVLDNMPKDGIEYHLIRGYSLDEVEEYLRNKDGVVLLTIFFKDLKDNGYEHYELIERLNKNIDMPLYGLWDINFGRGLIGGFLTSGFFHGREAAAMTKRVLNGEDINKIEIIKSPNNYMFDYKQMKKHGLHVEDLPKEHLLINYKKSFYEEYKKEIYLALSVITILSIIILFLLINIEKRKKAEKKLQESEKNLEIKVENRTEELKHTIETLTKTQNKLVYSEKMSALGGLVAGVSHEINTPIGLGLTGITHFLDITKIINNHYKNDNLSKEEFERYIEDSLVLAKVIFSNLQKSAELVRSFKQISVDQTSEAQRNFNLKEYTNEILVSLTNMTKNRKVLFRLNCENVSIYSYPGAYSQIMTNLFVNTLNHAFGKEQSGEVLVDVKKVDSKVLISFKDNGKGINEDNLDKIFNPFFTTNRNFGGSGLGLNIVYNIIKTTFDGEITCKSTIGVGTQFDIELKI